MAPQGVWNSWNANRYTYLNHAIMNLKRIFGALLTLLGTGGLIYAAVLFVNKSTTESNTKALIIYGILGFVFFIAGINLIRTTKDEA